ncbi:hypothetical protein ACA910_016692 [Epithemia clementina (nom. ined.)]
MGYDVSLMEDLVPSGLLDKCRSIKEDNPEFIVLARNEDKYEAYGVDAIMFLEHTDLRTHFEPLHNEKGPLPWVAFGLQEIQTYLDQLTSKNFAIAVIEEYEARPSWDDEAEEDDDDYNGNGSDMADSKERRLSQIVSTASPLYHHAYDQGDDDTKEEEDYDNRVLPRPCVDIIDKVSGYMLVEIDLNNKEYIVLENLAPEAVDCRLVANNPCHPLWYIPTPEECAKGKSSARKRRWRIPSKVKSPDCLPFSTEKAEAEQVASVILDEVVKRFLTPVDRDRTDEKNNDGVTENDDGVTENDDCVAQNCMFSSSKDFKLVQDQRRAYPGANSNLNRLSPLQLETATQLGLVENDRIIPLVHYVLAGGAKQDNKKFVRQWLLAPPPPAEAQGFADQVQYILQNDLSLPLLHEVAQVRKLQRQLFYDLRPISDQRPHKLKLFKKIHTALKDTIAAIKVLEPSIHDSFLAVLRYESNLLCHEMNELFEVLERAARAIEAVVVLVDAKTYEHDENVLEPLWCEDWRNVLQPAAAPEFFESVDKAKQELRAALREDLGSDSTLVQLIETKHSQEKALVIRTQPRVDGVVELSNRGRKVYTTERVQECVQNDELLCFDARSRVSQALYDLAKTIKENHSDALNIVVHTKTILSTASSHGQKATDLGWNRAMVRIVPPCEDDSQTNSHQLSLKNVWPYWIDRNADNTIDMRKMWFLTGPNKRGKSTLMRATAAAALLSICGFCAPAGHDSSVYRFDNLFVRGASADIPSENMSAFAAEMKDMVAVVKRCTNRSLVFVDELGKGTSPNGAVSLAAAILEDMVSKGVRGMFATHLHDILDLPLFEQDLPLHEQDRLAFKRMKIGLPWPCKVENGVRRDSMALQTAEQSQLPEEILRRAEDFQEYCNKLANATAPTKANETDHGYDN